MDSTDVPVLPCLNNDIGNPHRHTRRPCDQFYSTVHVRLLRHAAKLSTDKNNRWCIKKYAKKKQVEF